MKLWSRDLFFTLIKEKLQGFIVEDLCNLLNLPNVCFVLELLLSVLGCLMTMDSSELWCEPYFRLNNAHGCFPH